MTHAAIAKSIEIFEDKNDEYTAEELAREHSGVEFQRWNGNPSALEFGHSTSAFWLKIVLRNEEATPVQRRIEIANSHLAHVVFHQATETGLFKKIVTGNLERFDTRPVPNRYFVFPVSIKPRTSDTYFIKIKSSTQLVVPVNVWDDAEFQMREKHDYIFQSFYFGVILSISIFVLFYYFAVRDSLYLKYLALLLAFSFTLYSLNGLAKEYFIYDSAAWSEHSAAFGAAISLALLLSFMRHFLEINKLMPKTDRYMKCIMVIYPFPMFLTSLYPLEYFVVAGKVMTLSLIVAGMLIAIYLSWKKVRMAHFFVVGYSIPFVVFLINLLSAIKIIPQMWDVAGSTQSAFLVEMLVFSLALIDRTYQLRKQNEASRNTIINLQQQVLENLREKESRLEGLIEKRYKELRHLIDMLSHEIRTPMSIIRMYIGMENQKPQLKKMLFQPFMT